MSVRHSPAGRVLGGFESDDEDAVGAGTGAAAGRLTATAGPT